jgi:hypothetical protein
MQRNNRNLLLATAAVASLAIGGQASAQVIRITNANNHEIPLKAGSSVQIDSTGNLLAECALNASNVCAALSSTPPTGVPTVTFGRNDGDTDVRTNETVRLTWSTTLGEVCKATSTGPSGTTWTGVRTTSNTAGETVAVSAVGTYVFSMVCYNAAGASTVSQQSVVVALATGGGPVDPPANCNLTAGTPLFQPSGWTKVDRTWAQLFTPADGAPIPAYPTSNGFPVPVGSNKGTYVAASFTAAAKQSVSMFWDPAQAKPAEGYSTARPAMGMFISISPCPGDLRPADNSGGFLMSGCRKFGNSGSLIWSTSASLPASSVSACKLEAGKVYYINVLPANPDGGLTSGEHSCSDTSSSSQGCDVQARTTATSTSN